MSSEYRTLNHSNGNASINTIMKLNELFSADRKAINREIRQRRGVGLKDKLSRIHSKNVKDDVARHDVQPSSSGYNTPQPPEEVEL